MKPWKVYIIHFARKFYHCQHYIGMTNCIEERLQKHKSGTGAKIIAAALRAGNDIQELMILEEFSTARLARNREIQLKREKKSWKHCKICRENGYIPIKKVHAQEVMMV